MTVMPITQLKKLRPREVLEGMSGKGSKVSQVSYLKVLSTFSAARPSFHKSPLPRRESLLQLQTPVTTPWRLRHPEVVSFCLYLK